MILLFSGLILTAILMNSCTTKVENSEPIIQDGVLNLRNWDFDKQGIITLNGDWRFSYQNNDEQYTVHVAEFLD